MFARTMELSLAIGELNVLEFLVHSVSGLRPPKYYCTNNRRTMNFYDPISGFNVLEFLVHSMSRV